MTGAHPPEEPIPQLNKARARDLPTQEDDYRHGASRNR